MLELESRVLNTIQREFLFEQGDVVYVALSGGADSVALLHILISLQNFLGLSSVRALHVNHGIRGTSADRDEAFVRNLCKNLQVPLSVHTVNVPAEVAQSGESVEEAARRLRYSFFESVITKESRAKLATAHTADDQAETVLLHLTRGCGLKGITGIPVKRGYIVRPLIDCTADAIREYCNLNSYLYQIDETNFDMTYARNRVRHEIMPSLRRINSDVNNALIRFSKIATQEDRFLDKLAQKLLDCARIDEHTLDIPILSTADPVVCRRALLLLCQTEYRHISSLMSVLHEGGSVNLPEDIQAISDGKTLRFIAHTRQKPTIEEPQLIKINANIQFSDKIITPRLISYQEYQEKLKIHKNLFYFCVSYDMIESEIVLRSRMAGDSIRPFGRHCTKSLKKLYNELSIPIEKRHKIPIVASADIVMAILGICVDETFAVTDQTQQILWFDSRNV